MPDERSETLSEIADFLSDALCGSDEAYELAKEKLGESDPITEACLETWAAAETAFRLIVPPPETEPTGEPHA